MLVLLNIFSSISGQDGNGGTMMAGPLFFDHAFICLDSDLLYFRMSFSSKVVLFVIVCPCQFGDSSSNFLVVYSGSSFPCVRFVFDSCAGYRSIS